MLIRYLLFSYLKVSKPVKIDMEAFNLLCNSIHLLEKAEKPLSQIMDSDSLGLEGLTYQSEAGMNHILRWRSFWVSRFLRSHPLLCLWETQGCFCLCCQTEYVLSYFPKTSAVPCLNLLNSPTVILQRFLRGVTEEYFNNFGGSHENCNVRLCVPQTVFQCHFHFQRGNMSQWGGDPETRLSLISGWLGKSLKVSAGTGQLSALLLGQVSWKSWNVLLLSLLIFEIQPSYWRPYPTQGDLVLWLTVTPSGDTNWQPLRSKWRV